MARKVLIAIQARSSSERLPRKAFELISGKTMLDRVISTCKVASRYMNDQPRLGISARVAVLTPTGDPVAEEFGSRCDIIEGPLEDVLTRYVMAVSHFDSDYVVRITGDCPMLPSFIISKLVTLATTNGYDYVSNVDERFRTALDGADCEVISRALLEDTDHRAKDPYDREHVTTAIRRDPPPWAKSGFVCNHFDLSDVKLSVDTPEDLERVRRAFELAHDKYQKACLTFGQQAVHRV